MGRRYVASRERWIHDHEKNACKYVKPFTPTNKQNGEEEKNVEMARKRANKSVRGCVDASLCKWESCECRIEGGREVEGTRVGSLKDTQEIEEKEGEIKEEDEER